MRLKLRFREVECVHYSVLAAYAPQPYDGRLVLLCGTEQPAGATQEEALGWISKVRGGIDVIELPGNYDNLIEQPELLRQLRRVLEQVQATTAR